MRFFEGYRCGNCGREVPAGSLAGECPTCHGPLLGEYDLGLLRNTITRDEFFSWGEAGVWRFSPLLPGFIDKVSLGEGNTPLLHAGRLGSVLGMDDLWIKDESSNPTGSFKARGMAVAISRVIDLGASIVSIPSAGNAGLALAAYAAFSGVRAKIYLPSEIPAGFVEECRAYGGEIIVVPGILSDAVERLEEDINDDRVIVLSTFREPCRVEGKKTIAFEIESGFAGDSPDWILFPTGGGTGIVAIWKAYRELELLGWLRGARPRIAVVQSTGCAPVVRAFEKGEETIEPWTAPETAAAGIRVSSSRADRQIMKALRETEGTAVAVSEESIIDAVSEMARTTGVFPSPEGAASWAGLKSLVDSGIIERESKVVIVNTAGWSRYRFLLKPYLREY